MTALWGLQKLESNEASDIIIINELHKNEFMILVSYHDGGELKLRKY